MTKKTLDLNNIDDLINMIGEEKTAELFIEYFIRLTGPKLPKPDFEVE